MLDGWRLMAVPRILLFLSDVVILIILSWFTITAREKKKKRKNLTKHLLASTIHYNSRTTGWPLTMENVDYSLLLVTRRSVIINVPTSSVLVLARAGLIGGSDLTHSGHSNSEEKKKKNVFVRSGFMLIHIFFFIFIQ